MAGVPDKVLVEEGQTRHHRGNNKLGLDGDVLASEVNSKLEEDELEQNELYESVSDSASGSSPSASKFPSPSHIKVDTRAGTLPSRAQHGPPNSTCERTSAAST